MFSLRTKPAVTTASVANGVKSAVVGSPFSIVIVRISFANVVVPKFCSSVSIVGFGKVIVPPLVRLISSPAAFILSCCK